jgi:hypothetical protein
MRLPRDRLAQVPIKRSRANLAVARRSAKDQDNAVARWPVEVRLDQ